MQNINPNPNPNQPITQIQLQAMEANLISNAIKLRQLDSKSTKQDFIELCRSSKFISETTPCSVWDRVVEIFKGLPEGRLTKEGTLWLGNWDEFESLEFEKPQKLKSVKRLELTQLSFGNELSRPCKLSSLLSEQSQVDRFKKMLSKLVSLEEIVVNPSDLMFFKELIEKNPKINLIIPVKDDEDMHNFKAFACSVEGVDNEILATRLKQFAINAVNGVKQVVQLSAKNMDDVYSDVDRWNEILEELRDKTKGNEQLYLESLRALHLLKGAFFEIDSENKIEKETEKALKQFMLMMPRLEQAYTIGRNLYLFKAVLLKNSKLKIDVQIKTEEDVYAYADFLKNFKGEVLKDIGNRVIVPFPFQTKAQLLLEVIKFLNNRKKPKLN